MEKQCHTLQGAVAIVAQILLGFMAFGVLVVKRYKEKPQRPFLIWGMDTTKQVISSGAAHICGLLIAHVAADGTSVSDCAWYFVAFFFDTTLGVSIAVVLHKLALGWAKRRHATRGGGSDESWPAVMAECGNYGDPPSLRRFGIQLAEWCLAVILARLICGALVIAAKGLLVDAAGVLDHWFAGRPNMLLLFVMIMCPLLMNAVQALVQDAVLKWKRSRGIDAEKGKVSPGPSISISERDSISLLPREGRLSSVLDDDQ